jgi:penicillin amidase
MHRLEFVSPIMRKGALKGLLGGGSHPMDGSGETLYRAIHDFNEPFFATTTASLRMVADLSDSSKVLAVLPGGACGRLFDSHTTDQIESFMNGEKMYWWFSDELIRAHMKNTLVLKAGK